jgi:sialate O-acetylesterase
LFPSMILEPTRLRYDQETPQNRISEPGESNWAELRDAQLQTISIPKTSMAITIDLGDERDIHPKNIQGVGHRLSLLALRDVYGKSLEARGPVYSAQKVRWGKIHLSFTHVGEGLTTTDGWEPVGFSIARSDGKFHWAKAKIKSNRVIVSSPQVRNPVAVRYAWSANPDCILTNSSGIPASPFIQIIGKTRCIRAVRK